jgi:hypothetical protein
MDSEHFDRLSITLASVDTRRALLRLLLTLPLSAGLAGWPQEASGHGHGTSPLGGEGRRRRRKGKRKRNKRKGKGQPALTPRDDLQAAIDQAAPGATLVLRPGTWAVARTLVIAKNLTLAGAGAGQSLLDGGKAVRVLQIAPGTTVTVQDLTITQGHAAEGGGIFNAGILTLLRTSLVSNLAGTGGALFNAGTATLGPGTTVVGNTAIGAGSGQSGAGGGVFNGGALAALLLAAGGAVAAAIIAANSAESGGGIFNDGGTVTLNAGNVTGNTANEGAGIFSAGGTVLAAAGSRVTGNTASTAGGGIFVTSTADGVTLARADRVTSPAAVVSLASDDLVTSNTPNNCFPVHTIPYCIDGAYR